MTLLDSRAIQAIIPHRWPFLLVDRIDDLDPGVRAVGFKQISNSEPVFQGHFPDNPIFPAVMIVEALAQVGCVAILTLDKFKGKLVLFAGIDGFRFKRPVVPGDTVRLEVELTRVLGAVGKGRGRADVDGQVVAEGELLFAVADPESLRR